MDGCSVTRRLEDFGQSQLSEGDESADDEIPDHNHADAFADLQGSSLWTFLPSRTADPTLSPAPRCRRITWGARRTSPQPGLGTIQEEEDETSCDSTRNHHRGFLIKTVDAFQEIWLMFEGIPELTRDAHLAKRT